MLVSWCSVRVRLSVGHFPKPSLPFSKTRFLVSTPSRSVADTVSGSTNSESGVSSARLPNICNVEDACERRSVLRILMLVSRVLLSVLCVEIQQVSRQFDVGIG